MPADRNFTVNYSLNGYQPQAIEVGPRAGGERTIDVASGVYGEFAPAEVTPNPVYAQLQPAAPPAPTRKRGGKPPAKQPPR